MNIEISSAKASSDEGEMDISVGTDVEKGKVGKVSERYCEEDADVTLVSSDGMIFKVHSFLLVRAS